MCGLTLTAYHKLPKAEGFDPTDSEAAIAPEDERVPLGSWRHGRGPLLLLAVLGLVLFFLPWIDMQFPVVDQLSGVDLARRLGWTWAVPAAWFVLIPTVASRRTLRRMQSARVAVGMLAMFPGLAAATLLSRPPRGAYGLHLRFSFLWPLYGTLALSVIGLLLAVVFGVRGWTRARAPAAPTPAAGASPTKKPPTYH